MNSSFFALCIFFGASLIASTVINLALAQRYTPNSDGNTRSVEGFERSVLTAIVAANTVLNVCLITYAATTLIGSSPTTPSYYLLWFFLAFGVFLPGAVSAVAIFKLRSKKS